MYMTDEDVGRYGDSSRTRVAKPRESRSGRSCIIQLSQLHRRICQPRRIERHPEPNDLLRHPQIPRGVQPDRTHQPIPHAFEQQPGHRIEIPALDLHGAPASAAR